MIKSIVLDFTVLDKLELLITDFLYLVWINDKKVLNSMHSYMCDYNNQNLISKNYIKLDTEGNAHLRQSAIDLIEYLSIDSFKEFNQPKIVKKSGKKIKAEVVERINEFRNLWSGLKAGSMGSRQSCIDKLSRWMETNPEYSFDQILKAATLYLNTEGMNLTYIQRADYFIYKQENNKEESSRLSAFIDEIDTTVAQDWTSTLN